MQEPTLNPETELINKIKVSLKGELDSSNVDADILYYDELSRGRVLNRLYKLFSKELAKAEARARQEAVEEERNKIGEWMKEHTYCIGGSDDGVNSWSIDYIEPGELREALSSSNKDTL